jgi:hypothetical protein
VRIRLWGAQCAMHSTGKAATVVVGEEKGGWELHMPIQGCTAKFKSNSCQQELLPLLLRSCTSTSPKMQLLCHSQTVSLVALKWNSAMDM